jgi:hypothetical protein
MSAAPLVSPRIGIDALLPRLDRVQHGTHGWRADCPNGHKTRGTLSVAQGDDGRLLLHCFAGCCASDVLAALGLSMADIQPQRLRDPSPEGRRAAREGFKLASVAAAAAVLEREAELLLIAIGDILRGEPLGA